MLSILSGILLFIVLIVINLNNTVFNSSYHKDLFKKHKIYDSTYTVAKDSFTSFTSHLKSYSPENFNKYSFIFDLLEKSITSEYIKNNLDLFRDDLFKYFKGEREFLPDLYLNPSEPNNTSLNKSDATTIKNISVIDKINLSAILLYTNRNDIYDYLTLIKMLVYSLKQLSTILIIFLALLTGICFIKLNNLNLFLKHIKKTIVTTSLLSFFTAFITFIYSYAYLKNNIYPLTMSIPIESKVIYSYMKDLLFNFSSLNITIFTILCILYTFTCFLPKMVIGFNCTDKKFFEFKIQNKTHIFIAVALFLVTFSSIFYAIYKVGSLSNYYSQYGLENIFSKLSNSPKVTAIIPAKDDFLYSMQIDVIDSTSKKPLKDIKLLLNGDVENKKDFFNSTLTDSKGSAKFNIQKGTFRLSVDPYTLPKEYEQISSFFYDIQKPGTTLVKIELKPKQISSQEGIAEIEFLDKSSNPISGIFLYIDSKTTTASETIRYNSVSNVNGIAVFKLEKGTYKVFISEKILENYKILNPIEIEILPKKTNKYTLQVLKK